MKDKWNDIPNIIGDSLVLMLEGLMMLIPFSFLYLFGYWVLFLLGVNDSGEFGDGTIVALFLLYGFSIGLCAADGQRETDGKILALNNRLHQLSLDDSEINRRVSELVDRLEDGELDPDDKNVDLDTVFLINDTRRELEDIRDKLS